MDKLTSFHKSITQELCVARNRVRDLLNPHEHWPEDGRYKEVLLRQALKRHMPESLRIGTGFVKIRGGSSNQIDILISHQNKPTLFKDGEFHIVTHDAVYGLVEVKSSTDRTRFRTAAKKLADQ